MAGVTNQSPPNTVPFADFHHGPPQVPPFMKTRKDRREVSLAAPAPVPIPAPPPQVVYLPAPYPSRRRARADSYSSSPENWKQQAPSSGQDLLLPSVQNWLASLTDKPGAGKRNFPSMSDKLNAEDYLEMDVGDLAALPHEAFGDPGFKFTLAEVSFVRKWLDITMEELRPPKSHRESKRAKR